MSLNVVFAISLFRGHGSMKNLCVILRGEFNALENIIDYLHQQKEAGRIDIIHYKRSDKSFCVKEDNKTWKWWKSVERK